MQNGPEKKPADVRKNDLPGLANLRRRRPIYSSYFKFYNHRRHVIDSVSEGLQGQPGSASTTEHTKYPGSRSEPEREREMGIRDRYASHIYKTTRIWLGRYPTKEMAAAAALKGPDLELSFPNAILSCQIPDSMSPGTRAAAACAAEARIQRSPESSSTDQETTHRKRAEEEFIDEETLLKMPSLLMDMAEGMLVIKSSSDESGDDGDR